MTLLRSLLVFGLIFAVAGFADAADDGAKKKKKKKGAAAVQGVVKSVQVDKDKPDSGTLTVQVGKTKKGVPAPAGAEKKFTVTTATKIEKVDAKAKKTKGQPPSGQPAKFSDIQANARVFIAPQRGENNVADKVTIFAAKKKKANSQ
jgi:hypothetical protein